MFDDTKITDEEEDGSSKRVRKSAGSSTKAARAVPKFFSQKLDYLLKIQKFSKNLTIF